MKLKETLECRCMSNNVQIAERNRTMDHSIGLGKILSMEFFLTHSCIAWKKLKKKNCISGTILKGHKCGMYEQRIENAMYF